MVQHVFVCALLFRVKVRDVCIFRGRGGLYDGVLFEEATDAMRKVYGPKGRCLG